TDIEGLKEGELAPDCFGNWMPVTKIFAKGTDPAGRSYVCYYTQLGQHSSISNSLKEGRITRTVPLTAKFTSHELDTIERNQSCPE
ncbi:MAG: hypothetical protein ACLQBD_13020, partial [Syntrophobacteraceae bacterium]